jgi:hypothetical protein
MRDLRAGFGIASAPLSSEDPPIRRSPRDLHRRVSDQLTTQIMQEEKRVSLAEDQATRKRRLILTCACGKTRTATQDLEALDQKLLVAVMRSRESEVGRCLKRGADASTISSQRSTPLMWAASHGSLVNVKQLLGAGADSLAKNSVGVTALEIAENRGRYACANLIEAHQRRARMRLKVRGYA